MKTSSERGPVPSDNGAQRNRWHARCSQLTKATYMEMMERAFIRHHEQWAADKREFVELQELNRSMCDKMHHLCTERGALAQQVHDLASHQQHWDQAQHAQPLQSVPNQQNLQNLQGLQGLQGLQNLTMLQCTQHSPQPQEAVQSLQPLQALQPLQPLQQVQPLQRGDQISRDFISSKEDVLFSHQSSAPIPTIEVSGEGGDSATQVSTFMAEQVLTSFDLNVHAIGETEHVVDMEGILRSLPSWSTTQMVSPRRFNGGGFSDGALQD